MTFSLEELQSAHGNGSLEGLLLGYGLSPLKVLEFVLEEDNLEKERLLSQVMSLEDRITVLYRDIEDLEVNLWGG